jgi:predicted acyltransferase
MILVNNPGSWESMYSPLRHVEWNGWTFADLVFPFFLYITGASLVLSQNRRAMRGASRGALLWHAFWRGSILIVLGLLLNLISSFQLQQLRFSGVLQRIGVVYFLAAVLVTTTSRRIWAFVSALALLGYWAMMALIPVPGYGPGNLEPLGNLASYIDRLLMPGHLWQPTWDPEGLLSTIPALATVLFGAIAAAWIQGIQGGQVGTENRKETQRVPVRAFVIAALAAITMGKLWGVVFPINKNLWTSSFALFTAGMATLVLATCYWAIEMKNWRRLGQLFMPLGMNPLAIYVGSEIVGGKPLSWAQDRFFDSWFAQLGSAELGSLLWAVIYLCLWAAVAKSMYRRAVFIRL